MNELAKTGESEKFDLGELVKFIELAKKQKESLPQRDYEFETQRSRFEDKGFVYNLAEFGESGLCTFELVELKLLKGYRPIWNSYCRIDPMNLPWIMRSDLNEEAQRRFIEEGIAFLKHRPKDVQAAVAPPALWRRGMPDASEDGRWILDTLYDSQTLASFHTESRLLFHSDAGQCYRERLTPADFVFESDFYDDTMKQHGKIYVVTRRHCTGGLIQSPTPKTETHQ